MLDLNFWEVWGTLTGLVCVWLAAKENVFTWPIGIISALLYWKVFQDSKLFSDAWLQVFFAAFQLYGWFMWSAKKQKSEQVIIPITAKNIVLAIILTGLLWPIWFKTLLYIKPMASLAAWDSLTTVLSLLAVFFQAKKWILCWWIWILADLIYVPMYIYKELDLTAFLYLLFLALAVYGFYQWRKTLQKNKSNQATI
jgi:nicotinamide mononucleotide transporter